MIDIATLRAMRLRGVPADVILDVVEAELEAEDIRVQARRAKDAERQRRKRHADSTESRGVTRSHADAKVPLTSLLSSSVSTAKQAESKEVSKKERARKSQLPADWKPSPEHYAKAAKQNLPAEFVDRKADDLRDWALGKGVMRADWDRTFNGFLKPKENSNGFGGPRPLQDDSKSVSRAGKELAELARRGEFSFGPRPGLLPGTSNADVQLLPKGRGT